MAFAVVLPQSPKPSTAWSPVLYVPGKGAGRGENGESRQSCGWPGWGPGLGFSMGGLDNCLYYFGGSLFYNYTTKDPPNPILIIEARTLGFRVQGLLGFGVGT